MLCEFCSNFDLDELSSPGGYKHHASCSDLYRSSQNGCNSCKLICDSQWEGVGGPLSDPKLDSGPYNTQIIVRAIPRYPGNYKTLRYGQEVRHQRFETNDPPDISYLWCFVEIAAYPGDRSAEYLSRRPFVEPGVCNDVWYSFATRWLSDCLETHEACSTGSHSTVKPPTRVIDIGPLDVPPNPVLHVSGDEVREWVTLSHCWGQELPLQTTKETLHTRETALPLESLPSLFRDAVTITRQLGYRYLWVDSLCIIQNSEEDRAQEIAKMGEIYKNSILTIAADNCRDSNDKILGPAPPVRKRKYVEQGCHSEKRHFRSKMYAYFGDFSRPSAAPHSIENLWDKLQGMLSSRAWALQEQILSPRTLQWKPEQVLWSCRHTAFSEEYPSDIEYIDDDADLRFAEALPNQYRSTKIICLSQEQLKNERLQKMLTKPGVSDAIDPMQIWYLMVEQFLVRDITYETDALPAISGLAREVRRHTGFDYRAGLWSQDLHNGLLWWIVDSAEYPEVYVGPSWSWVSVKKTITNAVAAGLGPSRPWYVFDQFDIRLDPIAEIIGTDIAYASDDIFGPIKSATLRLKAPCSSISAFRESNIKFPLLSDMAKKNHYGTDHSGVLIDDGSIMCWMDARPCRENSDEELYDAVKDLRNSGAMMVMISSLSVNHATAIKKSCTKPFWKDSAKLLLNQNWSLVLMPLPVSSNEDGESSSREWRRAGVARVADDLINSENWDTREVIII